MVYRSAMLDRIRKNARAAALLADVFDFDVARLDPVEPVRLASDGELRVVAGDASGGCFFVWVPTWQDVVSDAPDVDAMRASFESSYAEMKADEPRIDQLRSEVAAELELDQFAVDELLVSLSKCLTELSPSYVLLNENGDEYDPL